MLLGIRNLSESEKIGFFLKQFSSWTPKEADMKRWAFPPLPTESDRMASLTALRLSQPSQELSPSDLEEEKLLQTMKR